MFTAEIKINGALIGILHAHNQGSFLEKNEEIADYEFEYYEPTVGISSESRPRNFHVKGRVRSVRGKGIRHVLSDIFSYIDKL